MKQLKIRDIRILLDVVNTQSFSLSAKNAGLTQASVSKAIATIEEIFDITIINRDSRPVCTTPFGEALLPHLLKYVNDTNELFELAGDYKKKPTGEVNIYSPSGMQAYLAEYILPSLCQNFPEISISLITSNDPNEEYFKNISLQNTCDILISYSPPQNINLVSRNVKRIRMDVFATPEFHKRHPFINLDELSQYPFILLNSMSSHRYETTLTFINKNNLAVKTVIVSGKLKFDNIYTAINCCKKEMGYMVTSPLLLQNIRGIVPVLPADWGMYIDCYVVYRSRKNLPFRVQLSLDYIIKLMSENEPI